MQESHPLLLIPYFPEITFAERARLQIFIATCSVELYHGWKSYRMPLLFVAMDNLPVNKSVPLLYLPIPKKVSLYPIKRILLPFKAL